MNGGPAPPRRPVRRSLPTRPCPHCGAAVPLSARVCATCAFPQPIRGPGGLPALLSILVPFILDSVVFGWTTTCAARATQATVTVQIRTALPGTSAGKEPAALTPSIQPADPAAGTPRAPATR
jgi:hypothetical protein